MGRLAVQVASILKGKHKPTYLPNKDMGDHVVIVNADKVGFVVIYSWLLLWIRGDVRFFVVDDYFLHY